MAFCQIRMFYRVLFAMQKRRYLRWFRAPVENHTIYMNLSCLGGLLAGCCVDGLGWLGWAGWVELAGFAGGLFGCLSICSTFLIDFLSPGFPLALQLANHLSIGVTFV